MSSKISGALESTSKLVTDATEGGGAYTISHKRRSAAAVKRSFDILAASMLLFTLMPFLLFVIIVVRSDGGPALFRQERVGRGGRHFPCYKFRSMRVDAEQLFAQYLQQNSDMAAEWHKFQKLKNDSRITRFGALMRQLSIDELPQLLNVIKGEMSMVGPRPILPNQKHYYGDNIILYQLVRPGLTGPWQVGGRNKLTFAERVTLECDYARNWNLGKDLGIMLKTLPVLLRKDQAF